MIRSGYYPLLSYYLINLTLIPYTVWWSTGSGWFTRFNFHIKMSSCVNFGKPMVNITDITLVRAICMQLTINTVIFNLLEFQFLFPWLKGLYPIDSDPWNEYNSEFMQESVINYKFCMGDRVVYGYWIWAGKFLNREIDTHVFLQIPETQPTPKL